MLQHPSDRWVRARYVVVHPAGNADHVDSCTCYAGLLADRSTYASMTLEELLATGALPDVTTAALRERYLFD